MKRKKINIGDKFGRLTVIKRVDDVVKSGRKHSCWECQCDCEDKNTIIVLGRYLLDGHIKSCGCYRRETVSQRRKQYNKWELLDSYAVGYTAKGNPFYVDIEDYPKVKDTCWYEDEKGYIRGLYNNKLVRLHRVIMNCPDDMLVDHIGGEFTRNDCRKANLRFATNSQNQMNKKLNKDNEYVTGVAWIPKDKRWKANIGFNNNRIYLGEYKTKEEAIEARKEAEEKYFGEYSYDNSQEKYHNLKNIKED